MSLATSLEVLLEPSHIFVGTVRALKSLDGNVVQNGCHLSVRIASISMKRWPLTGLDYLKQN